jgi:hypothetical protein
MKKLYIFWVGVLLSIGCASTRSSRVEIPLEQRDDALGKLAQLQTIDSDTHYKSKSQLADSIQQSLDLLNAEKIRVLPTPYVPFFIDDIDQAAKSDSSVVEYATTTDDYLLQINLTEFKFRTLVEAQRQLNHVFNNEIPASKTQHSDSTSLNRDGFEQHGTYGF